MFFGAVKFSMASAMTSMLALKLPLDHVVAMATWNPQRYFGLAGDLGHLGVGAHGDVTILNDERGRFVLSDNEGTQVVTDRVLTPAFCLKAGVRHDAVAPILPQVQAA
jgi:dihydroorotase